MAKVIVTVLTIFGLFTGSYQQHGDHENDINPLSEAANAILKEQNMQNIGGLVNNLMQSGGGKQLGDNAAQLLQNLDPSILNAVVSMVANQNTHKQEDEGFDGIFSLLGSFLGQPGNAQGMMSYLPMIMRTISAFSGPDADARAKQHEDHAWLLPPFMEKVHLFIDNFMHSEIGGAFVNAMGAEKFVKIFADENGKFSYRKFVDMLENHSFRKHWIRMVTDRIALFISYLADPKMQKKYSTSAQNFINSILKSQGYPKSTLFDPNRPSETLTAMVNHFVKTSFDMKVSSKQYVKPAVEYIQELLRLGQKKGGSIDSRQLSDKLADTINMEIIEPIARVNRAYRFATKVPQCDKYVLCLVNQNLGDENASLPGLRPLLSKGTSLVLGWFLSSQTKTSFWSYYHIITEENNCQARYLDACNDFHVEEIKVTTEYVHNEL